MTIQGSRGAYTVEGPLCEGGMGRLYIGKTKQGQKVVIKESKCLGDDEDAIRVEKLRVEGQILSNIAHKNIVRYVDSREEGTDYYLILEFIAGKTMKDLYWKNPAEENEVKRYALALLDALNYIHGLNIIHRDINPKNLLLPSDNLTLIDFGAAKYGYTQLLSFGQTIVGTPGWSAPEQFSGLATPRCDIYSVGAVIFFLLTGIPPHMYMRQDGTIEPPRKINPSITKEMENVILKAMNSDPSKRFQIAEDMIREIEGRSLVNNVSCLFCKGKKYPIANRLTIGRSPQCDITLNDTLSFVSRRHAQVFFDHGKYWIEDFGSTNGTYVYRNGLFQEVQKTELRDGDLIALCYKRGRGPYITLNFKRGAF